MLRMSDSSQPPETSSSISTSTSSATSANHQLSFSPQNDNGSITHNKNYPNLSPSNGRDDIQGDGSSSSELEEGEIIERGPPPLPLNNPISVVPTSSRRSRKPPPTTRPPLKDLPYAFPPDVEQSLQYRNSPIQPPFPSLYPHVPYR